MAWQEVTEWQPLLEDHSGSWGLDLVAPKNGPMSGFYIGCGALSQSLMDSVRIVPCWCRVPLAASLYTMIFHIWGLKEICDTNPMVVADWSRAWWLPAASAGQIVIISLFGMINILLAAMGKLPSPVTARCRTRVKVGKKGSWGLEPVRLWCSYIGRDGFLCSREGIPRLGYACPQR